MHAALRAVAVLVALLALVTGCSGDPPPGEQVPELAEQLAVVDAEIEDGDLAGARAAVEELVSRTALALTAEEISKDDADQILEAAQALLAELPEGQPADEQTPDSEGGGNGDSRENGPDDGHGN